jgi:hypothetical protein
MQSTAAASGATRIARKAAIIVTVKSRDRATRRWGGWSQRRCATASPQAKQTPMKRAGAPRVGRIESFARGASAGEDVTVLCGMAREVAIAGLAADPLSPKTDG